MGLRSSPTFPAPAAVGGARGQRPRLGASSQQARAVSWSFVAPAGARFHAPPGRPTNPTVETTFAPSGHPRNVEGSPDPPAPTQPVKSAGTAAPSTIELHGGLCGRDVSTGDEVGAGTVVEAGIVVVAATLVPDAKMSPGAISPSAHSSAITTIHLDRCEAVDVPVPADPPPR